MASIKKISARKFKITVSNGYRPDGRKISRAKTISVPESVGNRGIKQYVVYAAEEFERTVKRGYTEYGDMTFEEYAQRWLDRQTKYAPSTLGFYRRALEKVYKLIIATGMRCGECCGLKWFDVDYEHRSIHIQRNVVKVTGDEITVKKPKTKAGNRYVYFSAEMESLLKEYRRSCEWEAEAYEERRLTDDDYIFRRHGAQLPMTPTTFTWRFKLILKKHGLPEKLNVHSLRHTNASLLIAGGAGVATVAGLLGHAQPSTTLDIYTHAFDKNKKAASAALQERLEI